MTVAHVPGFPSPIFSTTLKGPMHHIHSPDNTDPSVERAIQAKGLNAPRVTPVALQANIVSEHYFTALQGVDGANNGAQPLEDYTSSECLNLLTFCVLVLKNGFTVTGESACASPANFDAAIGRRIAREQAEQKIWLLMGYVLKEQLYQNSHD